MMNWREHIETVAQSLRGDIEVRRPVGSYRMDGSSPSTLGRELYGVGGAYVGNPSILVVDPKELDYEKFLETVRTLRRHISDEGDSLDLVIGYWIDDHANVTFDVSNIVDEQTCRKLLIHRPSEKAIWSYELDTEILRNDFLAGKLIKSKSSMSFTLPGKI